MADPKRHTAPVLPDAPVPATRDAALEPAWLTRVLGGPVASVRELEVIRTVATKVRFAVSFEDGTEGAYCLKGLLDVDAATARGGPTCVLEADFYTKVAPVMPGIVVPECIAAVVDREAQQAVIVMRDLISDGARFCSALEPFTPDDALSSLAQLARLHARSDFLDSAPWIGARAAALARMSYITPETLQALLDDPRGDELSPRVRDAGRLIAAMQALAERDAARPQFMIHGDAHAGNAFRKDGQTGVIDWQLLQRGGWALDIAYHLNAVLPVEVAEAEERALLGEYLAMMRGHGIEMPGEEAAWAQYRESAIYGFFLWGITRRVDPPIIRQFADRLGKAVMRHESDALLGVD
jgi:hypothetical protein